MFVGGVQTGYMYKYIYIHTYIHTYNIHEIHFEKVSFETQQYKLYEFLVFLQGSLSVKSVIVLIHH